jgi:hypothetical protein
LFFAGIGATAAVVDEDVDTGRVTDADVVCVVVELLSVSEDVVRIIAGPLVSDIDATADTDIDGAVVERALTDVVAVVVGAFVAPRCVDATDVGVGVGDGVANLVVEHVKFKHEHD